MTDIEKGLIGVLVSLLKRIDILNGSEDIQEFFIGASDADEVVLHRLDGLYHFLLLERIRQIGDNKQEMFFLQITTHLTILLLVLILLQQFRLQVLQQLIDLNLIDLTFAVFSTHFEL